MHRPASLTAYSNSPAPPVSSTRETQLTAAAINNASGNTFSIPSSKHPERATAIAPRYSLAEEKLPVLGDLTRHSPLLSHKELHKPEFANKRNNALQSGWKMHLEHMRHFRLLLLSSYPVNPSEYKQTQAVSSLQIYIKLLVFHSGASQ